MLGGVKVEGDKRLQCGEEVSDPKVVEKVMKLINEFMRRLEEHRDVLLSDSTTPFDQTINELSNWLMAMEGGKAKESNDPTIAELRKAMIEVAKKMIELARQAREKWLRTYRRELEELIEKLRRNEVTIIIRGEPFNEDKSFMTHLYTEHIAIEVTRVRGSGVAINVSLVSSRSTSAVTPKLFGDNALKPLQHGLFLTDGSINKKCYPEMSTNQTWQVIAWLVTWPGRNAMHIEGMNLNETNINIKWRLTAVDHRNKAKNKARVAEEVSKFSDDEFLTFLLFAILGDGNINVEKKTIRLVIGDSKHELWRGGIIDRMKAIGFRDIDREVIKYYSINSSKAVELARKWLSNTLIRVMIEDLSQLSDAEKFRRLLALASTKIKPIGRSLVEVAGVWMNVHVKNNGGVELRIKRKRLEDARAILERLRNTDYNAELSPQGNDFVVYISYSEVMKHQELVAKVCEALRRMHEEAVGEGSTERAWAIAKVMSNLNCPPTQSPRA